MTDHSNQRDPLRDLRARARAAGALAVLGLAERMRGPADITEVLAA